MNEELKNDKIDRNSLLEFEENGFENNLQNIDL